MTRVLDCLTQQHDYNYVLFAAIICIAGAWTTLQLFFKTQQSPADQKLGWVFLTAVVGGSTIWTTHFLGMLGYDPLLPHGYAPFLTLLSWLAAVAACVVAFTIAITRYRGAALIAGALFGAGIGIMHYTGMLAFHVSGFIEWDVLYVVASIVFAIVLGAIADNLSFLQGQIDERYYGYIVMGIGIITAILRWNTTKPLEDM